MPKAKKINTKLNMARWIQALRSGRYKQTISKLRDNTGYCCLGVACAISKLGKWNADERAIRVYTVNDKDSSWSSLPEAVQGWLGVLSCDPDVMPGLTAQDANDIHGKSFNEIADGLEALYLGGKKAKTIVARAKARADKAEARRVDAQQRAR